jgi:hypothetical protein
MFIAALVTTAKLWSSFSAHQPMNGLRKMWYICKTEYYSARKNRKKNEIMSLSGKWTELE